MYYDGEKCRTKTFYENTEVTFYPMTHEEIVGYLATGDPFDKAGSYGIQTQGGLFVKGIKAVMTMLSDFRFPGCTMS